MTHLRRGILSLSIAALLSAYAQAAMHRSRIYPNPLQHILSIVEGPDGLLWLATTDGLYRFDGFHYHRIANYPFSSARFLAFTRDGALWVGGLEGLARMRNGVFDILSRSVVMSIAGYPDKIFVKLNELMQVNLDGSMRPLGIKPRRDLHIDSEGRLWFTAVFPDRAGWMDPDKPEIFHDVPLPPGPHAQIAPAGGGRIWASLGDTTAALVENGRVLKRLERRKSRDTSRPGPILAGRNGQLWFVGETIQGLIHPVEFRDRADFDRFTPTAALEDSRGHLWVAGIGQGLIEWIPDSDWQRWFPDDLGGEPTVQVARGDDGAALLATHKNIYRLQPGAEKWTSLMRTEHRVEAILPLPGSEVLASLRDLGLARIGRDGSIVERVKSVLPIPEEFREIARDGKGRVWVGAKRGLFRLEGSPGNLRLKREELPGLVANEPDQAIDLETGPDGRLWVGYSRGIAHLDDAERWHKIDADESVSTIRSIALDGDSIWVAYRRSGLFSRLDRKGDSYSILNFSAYAGTAASPYSNYGPANTDFLKRDSRGWIWRGTETGLAVSDGRNVAPNDWLRLHLETGMASEDHNQYGFYEDSDGSVWIAGEEGLTHLRPSPSWFAAPRGVPPPQVTKMEADSQVSFHPAAQPAELAAATRTLRIDLGSLHAPAFRDHPLRYRLLPLSDVWQTSADGTLEFADLKPGSYTLEMGYTGVGPSAVSAYSFRIGPAPGWTWLWRFGFLLAAFALTPAVRYLPWYDLAKFRFEKGVFMLRRRFDRRSMQSPSGAEREVNDYSGQTLAGRYRLQNVLSRGGFSVVYEARDVHDSNVRLAVKVLNRNYGDQSWVRDRFAHEVAALRSVDHRGVVRVIDSWISAAGEPCLAMPFLEGPTLRAALTDERSGLDLAAARIRELGAALSEVHGRGIIHRDLKPENLILRTVDGGEQPVIIDFGTAGLRSGEHELAATTLMAGSFHYMAPERLTGHYSPASDIFSLGVIVLEILTGKRLVDLDAMFADASFGQELEKVLRSRLGRERAVEFAAVLRPAFDSDPRRRPLDVLAWTDKLASYLEEEAQRKG
jgi:hypothetical protein